MLYAGDRSSGLLVMEDLGEGNGLNVDDALNGRDAEVAAQALVDLARATGQLHGQTAGRAEDSDSIRHRLGPPAAQASLFSEPWSDARRVLIRPTEIESAIETYQTQCASIGVHPSRGFDAEIEHVAQHVENPPASLLALSQGDQNGVGGLTRSGKRLRMYDFDAAGYRHALREGVPARITWGAMLRVPPELIRQWTVRTRQNSPVVVRWSPTMANSTAPWWKPEATGTSFTFLDACPLVWKATDLAELRHCALRSSAGCWASPKCQRNLVSSRRSDGPPALLPNACGQCGLGRFMPRHCGLRSGLDGWLAS